MYRENFPQLTDSNHEIKSPFTWDYNCIAWTLGDTTIFWSPIKPYYWPRNVPRNAHDVSTIVKLYELHGFVRCERPDTSLEDGFEKVALYTVAGGDWRHAALQLPNGRWTSKLGQHEDLEHDTAEALLGGEYEAIACVLRRPRKPAADASSSASTNT
jgi:hypothetical protein